jgi:lipoyl(octanoyl) transferase
VDSDESLISVIQLGLLDYGTGLRLQQQVVALRKENKVGDVLLLLEHNPVITLGRNAKRSNVIAAPEELDRRGIELFECDRGGDVTFHGPGQLVGYPIFDLRGINSSGETRKTLGAVEYVRRLEEVLIRTCRDFAISVQRISGLTGVWTAPESIQSEERSRPSSTPRVSTEEGKIAALGVHISRAVTSHGFALNVNTDLEFFRLIIPCGITSRPVTSMKEELGHEIPLESVAHSIARNFGTVFGSQMLWLEDLESLLNTSVGVPMRPPGELRRMHKEEDTFWA